VRTVRRRSIAAAAPPGTVERTSGRQLPLRPVTAVLPRRPATGTSGNPRRRIARTRELNSRPDSACCESGRRIASPENSHPLIGGPHVPNPPVRRPCRGCVRHDVRAGAVPRPPFSPRGHGLDSRRGVHPGDGFRPGQA
jgi:hypothetical protein